MQEDEDKKGRFKSTRSSCKEGVDSRLTERMEELEDFESQERRILEEQIDKLKIDVN